MKLYQYIISGAVSLSLCFLPVTIGWMSPLSIHVQVKILSDSITIRTGHYWHLQWSDASIRVFMGNVRNTFRQRMGSL